MRIIYRTGKIEVWLKGTWFRVYKDGKELVPLFLDAADAIKYAREIA